MDETAISHIIQGDAKAFESIFHQYYGMLCGYAVRFLRDDDEAEEIVQETFVRLWHRREELNIRHSLKSYLYQSVRNSCLNQIKHQAVVREHEAYMQVTAESATLDDTVVAEELDTRIREAIDRLPPERRKIFRMSRQDGLKYGEIAEKMGISPKTVENQMGRALKFLREELADFLMVLWILYINIFGGWG